MSRLFVALTPPPAALGHLDVALTRRAGPRWVPPERWHVTLAFLGDTDAEEAARGWTARAAGVAPFQLALRGAGQFRRRVLWIGLDVPPSAWWALADEDQQAHLTVARSRLPVDFDDDLEALSAYAGPVWTAASIELFDSDLASAADGGPTHRVISTIPLSG